MRIDNNKSKKTFVSNPRKVKDESKVTTDKKKFVAARQPSNSSIILVGQRKHPFYAKLVKDLFAQKKHEMIELHGLGDEAIEKTAAAVSILTRHGYCEVVRIKTGPSPSLRISLKPTDKFQEKYDAFQDEVELRKLEREAAVVDKVKPVLASSSDSSIKAEAGGSSDATNGDETSKESGIEEIEEVQDSRSD